MKKLIIIAFLSACYTYSIAQEIPEKFRMYKTKVRLLNEKKAINGIFYSINDSSIVLGTASTKFNYRRGNYETVSISIEDIKKIRARRKGKEGKSIGIGLGIGALFGGILGYSTGDWDSEPAYHPDSQAYFGAVLFGLMGGGIGLVAGIPSNYHKIGGEYNNYLKHKKKFNKYAIIKE